MIGSDMVPTIMSIVSVGIIMFGALIKVMRDLERVATRVERITHIEALLQDTRDRVARMEGAQHARPNSVGILRAAD